MRFSQRIGKSEIKIELEKGGISNELRNTLWTVINEDIIKVKINEPNENYFDEYSEITKFFRNLWINLFKFPVDNLPTYGNGEVYVEEAVSFVRDAYFKAEWYLALDLLEFCINLSKNPKLKDLCNELFKREFSAYRFVNGVLVEVTTEEEIIEIERALEISDEFRPVKIHLQRALELMSDRRNPDYRNSIKESISAVESFCKIILKNDKVTLGKALNEIEKKYKIPGGLKAAFSSLYGFTSDDGGIRHSLLEGDIKVEVEESRFMLIICSAFVNYLLNKI